MFLLLTQYHSARFRSLFFPDRPKQTTEGENQTAQPLLYGVNVDMSQILPTSRWYIVNEENDDLIDIAARLGISMLRITNNTRSFNDGKDAIFTPKEWNMVLDKMQRKNIKALIVIETSSNNANFFSETIHADYLGLVNDYIIDSDVLFHPTVYGIDLKNEPILNENNIKMIREAAHMIKTIRPSTRLTVGWWAVETSRKDEDGKKILNWDDAAAGRQIDDIVDFYSLHIYGFDKQEFGLHSDPYTYTKRYIANAKRDLRTKKPILVEEFGAGNGHAISDQETVGNPQLQANAYAGVYKAIVDMDDPQIVGALSYQFHSQSDDPDAWAILRDGGNALLPAAYVLQKFATGNTDIPLTIPMDPVPRDYLFKNEDDDTSVTLREDDSIGLTLSLDPSYQYSAVASDKSILSLSQQLTYNKKFGRYHAVFHARDQGKTRITVRRNRACDDRSGCDDRSETVFSMRFAVE